MPADEVEALVTTVSAPDEHKLHLSLSPTPEAVRDAHSRISAWLERREVDAVLRGNTEIVLGEALNNVVEHAFAAWSGSLSQTNAIWLEIRRSENGLDVCICDRGDEMPGLVLPDGTLPAISEQTELLPEGGFGWYLIRELASELAYRRKNGWNRLDMRIDGDAA